MEKKTKKDASSIKNICTKHDFTNIEISEFQTNLLDWYDKNQRVLPWRDIAKNESDPNIRGYAVWVSEIMLQQTQVATVISYFNKWMEKWPTVSHLASATLEDVNKVWAGLGYYSRARRLHEGSNIIMKNLKGIIPQNVNELMNLIPGIGLYSASAIASVAFQKPVGVVDGNVIRVLSRVRIISAPATQADVRDNLWKLANKIVSIKRPGDFNQALMELGAVICTPQSPKCSDCPINSCCQAYIMSQNDLKVKSIENFLKNCSRYKMKSPSKNDDIPDIENVPSCRFCIQPSVWNENPQVTAYPCKTEKKASRIETVGVVVVKKGDCFLMTKRPEKGLLAGLWEFPNTIFSENSNDKESSAAVDSLLCDFGIPASLIAKRKYIRDVVHIFSHIRTTYVVEYLELNNTTDVKNVSKEVSWSTEEEIKSAAISTAMKKVFHAVKDCNDSPTKAPAKKRKKNGNDIKQKSIKSFFT